MATVGPSSALKRYALFRRSTTKTMRYDNRYSKPGYARGSRMQLKNYFVSLSLLTSFLWAFEIGSLSTKIAVVVLFTLTLWVAAIVPATTLLTRLPKWILVLLSTGLIIAQIIFTLAALLRASFTGNHAV
jgi:hypothetical protein